MATEHPAYDLVATTDDSVAFVEASLAGNIDTMRKLLHKGIDPLRARNWAGWSALSAAIIRNQQQAITLLLGTGRYGTDELSHALNKAICSGHANSLRALVANGAPINEPYSRPYDNNFRNDMWTRPLHHLAEIIDRSRPGGLAMLKVLLNEGADPNCRDADGNTPLHKLAAGIDYDSGRPGVRATAGMLLVAAGASPLITNNAGDLPEGLARKKRFHALAELLHEASARSPDARRSL